MPEYRVLGPVEALADGRPVRLAPRPRAVLAVLLLHAGHVVPASRLIDAVWGDGAPDTAANVLQGYVSSLRKALGRHAVETRDPGYPVRAAVCVYEPTLAPRAGGSLDERWTPPFRVIAEGNRPFGTTR